MMRTDPCACGGAVTADDRDPTPLYREHLAGLLHRRWRERSALSIPPLPDPTAPAPRVDLSAFGLEVRPIRRRPGWVRVPVR